VLEEASGHIIISSLSTPFDILKTIFHVSQGVQGVLSYEIDPEENHIIIRTNNKFSSSTIVIEFYP
jgi:hypothetical protein